jgi:hypothetical protein
MAALPPNSTARYFVDYSNSGHDHTALVRTAPPVSPAAFGTSFDALMTQISDLVYECTINGVRFAADGSDISLPVVTGIEGNTYGSGSAVPQGVPNYLRFQGRSAGGRRCSFDLFSINLSDANFRITAAENGDVGAAVDILNAATNLYVGIDGLNVTWYPYVNTKASSYWTRAIRNG